MNLKAILSEEAYEGIELFVTGQLDPINYVIFLLIVLGLFALARDLKG